MRIRTQNSLVVSAIISVIIFSLMQIWKTWLSSSNSRTLLAGVLGCYLCIFTVTAFGNLKNLIFGRSEHLNLFPDVVFAVLFSMMAAASVHRIAGNICFLLCIPALYCLNRYSQKIYNNVPSIQQIVPLKKKKNI